MKGRVAIALLVVVAAVIAVALALLLRSGGDSGITRAEYIDAVNLTCRTFEERLERIPPPANFANPRIVEQAFAQALPVLEEQLAAVRAVEPPEAMRAQVDRMLAATEAGVAAMRRVLAAARAEDVPAMGDALTAYLAARERARSQSEAVGVSC